MNLLAATLVAALPLSQGLSSRLQARPSMIIEMSVAQKVSFLKSHGVSLNTSELAKVPNVSLDIDHAVSDNRECLLNLVGGMDVDFGYKAVLLYGGPESASAVTVEIPKLGAKQQALVVFYGTVEAPVTLHLQNGTGAIQDVKLPTGMFSVPLIVTKSSHGGTAGVLFLKKFQTGQFNFWSATVSPLPGQ